MFTGGSSRRTPTLHCCPVCGGGTASLREERRGIELERHEMETALAHLQHDRMVATTHAVIAALRRDLVDPADFAA